MFVVKEGLGMGKAAQGHGGEMKSGFPKAEKPQSSLHSLSACLSARVASLSQQALSYSPWLLSPTLDISARWLGVGG